MNFFNGIVEKAGDRIIVSAGGFKLPVDKAVFTRCRTEPALFCLRGRSAAAGQL